jgi:hypothetical protein
LRITGGSAVKNKSLRNGGNLSRKRFGKRQDSLIVNARKETTIDIPASQRPKAAKALSAVTLKGRNGSRTKNVRAQVPHNKGRHLRIAYMVGNDLVWRCSP